MSAESRNYCPFDLDRASGSLRSRRRSIVIGRGAARCTAERVEPVSPSGQPASVDTMEADDKQTQSRRRKRSRATKRVQAANHVAAADGVAELGARLEAGHALRRTGAVQHATAAMKRGVPLEKAAAGAATVGKGAYGEVQQVASFNGRAAALGKPTRAKVNRVANAPRDDAFIRTVGRATEGRQFKNAKPAQLERAISSQAYDHVVVPTEHCGAVQDVAARNGVTISDRLGTDLVAAEPMSIEASTEITTELLERILRGDALASEVDRLGIALKAGAGDALVTMSLQLVAEVADAAWHRRPIDLKEAATVALVSGLKAGARTSIQTRILLSEFTATAQAAFRLRLVQRVTASTLVAGAVAELVVETAFDFVAVLRGEMTHAELLERFGVNAFRAAGGLAGAALACAVTRWAPAWVTVILILVFSFILAWLAEKAGRLVIAATRKLLGRGENEPDMPVLASSN